MSFPVRTTTLSITSGDLEIPAYLAEPASDSVLGGVVVLQEVFGVNSHIRDVTERLAREGYRAIAPHLFHRQAPHFEVGYTEVGLTLGRTYKMGTRAEDLLRDVQAAIDTLLAKDTVRPGGVGCLGFCFGGHVAYLAATLPQVKATASFYGAGLVTSTPGGGAPTLSRTPDIGGTIYGFFGENDPLIPLEEVDCIEATLTEHRIPHQIFRYPQADHGFFCDQRDSYNATAAQAAWAQVLDLFEKTLNDSSITSC